MMMRAASLLAVLLLAVGCYLPMNFQADLNIDKSGKFAFRYRGDILAVTLMRKISFGKVKGTDIAKQAAIYKRDLGRDSGFKKIEHINNALFRVEFDRQGDIRYEKTFSFVRSNALFLALKRNKDGTVEVFGDRPAQTPRRCADRTRRGRARHVPGVDQRQCGQSQRAASPRGRPAAGLSMGRQIVARPAAQAGPAITIIRYFRV